MLFLSLFIFFIALGIVPWLLLSRRWTWWLGSAIGAAVGLFAALAVLFTINPPNLNICIVGPCSTSPPPATPAVATLALYVILLGLYGGGQAVTLRGAGPKVGWLATSVFAGLAFGVVLQVGSQLARVDPGQLPLGPSIFAGAAAGAILGAGALWLQRSASLSRVR